MALAGEARRAVDAVLAGSKAGDLESHTLDFKVVGRSTEDMLGNLAEAAACFANASGGQIVIGVADRETGADALVGAASVDVERVQSRIFEMTVPGLVTTVSATTVLGRRLVVVDVPRSPTVHQVKGRSLERVGTSCVQMTAQRIGTVLEERQGRDWSSDDAGLSIDRASASAVEAARSLLRASVDPERRSWAEASTPDLLRRLGVVAPAGTLTRAGAVLLVDDGTAPVHYLHRKARSGELTTNERLRSPGLTALLRCFELIDIRIDRTPVNLPTGQQLFVADLPEAAFREALVNAVTHRNYVSEGAVQVEHSPTQLTVTSPGPFVSGVTVDNILTVSSRPRNPSLAIAIRHLGLAETAGVGVDRMYAEMARVGHHPPTFRSDAHGVSVTLTGGAPNTAVTRFVATLPDERRSDPDTLLVLLTLLTRRTVTASHLSPLLQKGQDEVEVVLQQLAAPPLELVERTRDTSRSRRGSYRLRGHVLAALGPAVAYQSRRPDETDRKIVEIVQETGQINARMVRTLLDVDAPGASRILGDLVTREILTKTSEATRGPGVTYGPGPRFPRSRSRRR